MTRTAKKLIQSALSTVISTMATGVAGGRTQVTQIFLANNGTATRYVTLYAHGTVAANVLLPKIEIYPESGKILDNLKIVLAAGETLSAKQDTGTDVILTAYGVEEA